MQPSYSKIKVYSILAAGLLTFGAAPIMVKFATEYSPLLLVNIRTAGAFLMLIPFYIYQRQNTPAKSPHNKDTLLLVCAGLALGIHFTLWLGSLYYTSVASASVLVTIHPIMLIIAERVLFKMKFPITVWVGVLIAFSGSVLLGYSDFNFEADFENSLLGNFMALMAAIIFAVYFLIGRKLRQSRSWLDYVFPVYGYAALTCLIILLLFEGIPTEIDGFIILIGLGLAVGPQIMGHGALNYAVKYVSATVLSTLILTEPILATILALIILGEIPAVLSVIAIIVTLIGVTLTWKRRKKLPT